MAITDITDLTEVQASELTNNDLIAVGTLTGWKKIKANALGGGGGVEDFVVEFTITPGETFAVTSETTLAQIYAAYQQGKNIKGVGAVAGLGDVIFQMVSISDSLVVFFTFIEMIEGDGMNMTIRGTTSGYSGHPYQ